MKYLAERSLFYYFLMDEVADAGPEAWTKVAGDFGAPPEQIQSYRGALADPTLGELLTEDDIEMYRNFIGGFFRGAPRFGAGEQERDVMEAKLLAIRKAQELFGKVQDKGNRLRALSRMYERDGAASVLYALRLLHGGAAASRGYAEDILTREFWEGRNSDAGFILLRREIGDAAETAAALAGLPDMLLRPEMQEYITEKYGGDVTIKARRTIGF